VIPDGYTGAIIFAEVEGYGSGFEIVDGKYLYSIPPSGVLCVGSYAPLQQWHRLTAQYSSGGVIYSELYGLPQPPGPEAIRIRDIGQRTYGVHAAGEQEPRTWPIELWIGVGTNEQIEQVAQQWQAEQTGFDVGRCSDA
jgi:hypothetical protein